MCIRDSSKKLSEQNLHQGVARKANSCDLLTAVHAFSSCNYTTTSATFCVSRKGVMHPKAGGKALESHQYRFRPLMLPQTTLKARSATDDVTSPKWVWFKTPQTSFRVYSNGKHKEHCKTRPDLSQEEFVRVARGGP
eukprot:1643602-Amphidinium_carterae.1